MCCTQRLWDHWLLAVACCIMQTQTKSVSRLHLHFTLAYWLPPPGRHTDNRLFRNCGMPPLADYRPPCVCACVIIRLSSSASQYHTHPSIWAARLSRCLEVCPSLQRCWHVFDWLLRRSALSFVSALLFFGVIWPRMFVCLIDWVESLTLRSGSVI